MPRLSPFALYSTIEQHVNPRLQDALDTDEFAQALRVVHTCRRTVGRMVGNANTWALHVVTQRSENIEVHAAHLGLGYQAAALYAVADRLAQPEGGWTPFVPPRWARAAYPRPTERIAPTPD